jgi:hypothetical protein
MDQRGVVVARAVQRLRTTAAIALHVCFIGIQMSRTGCTLLPRARPSIRLRR